MAVKVWVADSFNSDIPPSTHQIDIETVSSSHSHSFTETIAIAPRTRRCFVPSSHAIELWGWRQGAMAGFNSTYLNVTLDEVKANFAFFGLLDEQVRLRGPIPRRPILPAAS